MIYSKLNKLDDLELSKLLKTYNLPGLHYKDTENLNRPLMIKEVEAVIQNLPIKKRAGPNGFTDGFYQTLKEKLMLTFLKLFQKNWTGGNNPKFILWSQHYSNTKTKLRHYKKAKIQTNISSEHRCRNS